MVIVSQDRELVEFGCFDFFVDKSNQPHTGVFKICASIGDVAVTLGEYIELSTAKDVLNQLAVALSTNQAIFYIPPDTPAKIVPIQSKMTMNLPN